MFIFRQNYKTNEITCRAHLNSRTYRVPVSIRLVRKRKHRLPIYARTRSRVCECVYTLNAFHTQSYGLIGTIYYNELCLINGSNPACAVYFDVLSRDVHSIWRSRCLRARGKSQENFKILDLKRSGVPRPDPNPTRGEQTIVWRIKVRLV